MKHFHLFVGGINSGSLEETMEAKWTSTGHETSRDEEKGSEKEKGGKNRGRDAPQRLLCNNEQTKTTRQRDLLERDPEGGTPADLRRRGLVMTLHQMLAAAGPAKHAGGGQHGEMGTGGQGGCLVSGKESQRAHTGGMEECCSYTHTHTHRVRGWWFTREHLVPSNTHHSNRQS